MPQTQSLKKLLQGQSLHQKDRKEIVQFFSIRNKSDLRIFSKKSKLEMSVFEKYIKNSNFIEFGNRYREGLSLILKEKLNRKELRRLKIFTLINRLIQSVELENNFKKNLYKQLNEIEEIRNLNEPTKNEIVTIAVGSTIEAIAYNEK